MAVAEYLSYYRWFLFLAQSTPPTKAFDLSIMREPLFYAYVIGLSCGHTGYVNLCMFLPPFATEVGIPVERATLMLSVIGISDLVGRILGGWFADLGLLQRSTIMAICLTFTG